MNDLTKLGLYEPIPLNEAAGFFIATKRFSAPNSAEEGIKLASARMRSKAQELIGDLMAGKMPEGKYGHFKYASKLKLAQPPDPNMEMPQPGGPQTAAPQQMIMPPQQMPQQAPAPQMPQVPKTMPTNYIEAEGRARAAQDTNEAAFLRERLGLATQKNQEASQQLEQTMGELDNMKNEMASSGVQAQTAQQQAVEATQRAAQHSQQAANFRMGLQQMREQLFQLASQDPEASMQDTGQQQQAQGAPTEAEGQSAPGTVPAGAGRAGESESEPASGEPGTVVNVNAQPKQKLSGAFQQFGQLAGQRLMQSAPYALGGALVGAGSGALEAHRDIGALEGNVHNLESLPDSFKNSVSLALAKAKLDIAKASKAHPTAAVLSGAATGALSAGFAGPKVGPAIFDKMKHLGDNISKLRE